MVLAAVAVIPAVAEAQPSGTPTLHVSVTPCTGSAHTRLPPSSIVGKFTFRVTSG